MLILNDVAHLKLTVQCNFSTTATSRTEKKWLLQGDDCYGKVKYIIKLQINSTALRKAKIVYNFGCSECNRVKDFKTGCSTEVTVDER